MNASKLPRQNTEAEIEAFERVFERLSGFKPELMSEWADGFLTALAAGPSLPPPEVWLDRLCGETFARAFADPQDVEQATHAIELRLRVLCDQLDPAALMEDPQALRVNPLMTEWTDEDRAAVVAGGELSADQALTLQTGASWAEGFADGVEAFPELWVEPLVDSEDEDFVSLTDQILALTLRPDSPVLDEHIATYYPKGAPTRDELLAEAIWAVQDLRLYWLDRALKPATRHVEPKPGRNDPCPCGSGKKYKKCHGAVVN